MGPTREQKSAGRKISKVVNAHIRGGAPGLAEGLYELHFFRAQAGGRWHGGWPQGAKDRLASLFLSLGTPEGEEAARAAREPSEAGRWPAVEWAVVEQIARRL